MKRFILQTVLILLVLSVIAQEKKSAIDKNHLFSVSIPRFALNTFSINYEYLLKNNKGIMLNAGIILKESEGDSKFGGNAELQFRIYPIIMKERVFQGLYFAPYVGYRYVEVEKQTYIYDPFFEGIKKDIFKTMGAGVAIGCKVAIVQTVVFTFELGGGIKYTKGPKGNYSIFDYGYSGITPKTDITVGIFF